VVDQVAELAEQGYTIPQICVTLDKTYNSVRGICQRNNIKVTLADKSQNACKLISCKQDGPQDELEYIICNDRHLWFEKYGEEPVDCLGCVRWLR